MHDVARDDIVAKELVELIPAGNPVSISSLTVTGLSVIPLPVLSSSYLPGYRERQRPLACTSPCRRVLSGYPIVRNSIVSTITNKRLNAEVLVTCALIASIWVGEYLAAAIVVLMMNVGELLEDITIAKTGEAVRALMELESDTARVIRNGRELEIDIEDVGDGRYRTGQVG